MFFVLFNYQSENKKQFYTTKESLIITMLLKWK